MKKLLCGVLCALGISVLGCEMEVPKDQVGSFSLKDFCQLTGGLYIESYEDIPDYIEGYEDIKKDSNDYKDKCICGKQICDEYVTCIVNENNQQVCMGTENVDHPQYTCTLKGMQICFDRVVERKTETGYEYSQSGYYVECDGATWSVAQECSNGVSCKTYLEHNMLYSTKCGDCQNNNTTCINGTIKEN